MRRHRLEGNPVRVPATVLKGLEAVRATGLTNMLDRPAVARLAESLGYPETAEWIRANPTAYAEGIFRGFVAEVEFDWDAPIICEDAAEGFHSGNKGTDE